MLNNRQLNRLLAKLRKRETEYLDDSIAALKRVQPDPESIHIARYVSNRYEGISTATRWAIEDILNLLHEPPYKS